MSEKKKRRAHLRPEAIIKATFLEAGAILAQRADYLRSDSSDDESDHQARDCFGHAISLSRIARLMPDSMIEKILKDAKA